MQIAKRRVLLVLMVSALILLNLTACNVLSRYDEHSYQSLTSLKAQVKIFFEDCSAKSAQGEKALSNLQDFRLKIAQAYEYEAGKKANTESVTQIRIISSLLNESYNRFLTNKFDGGVCHPRSETEPEDTNKVSNLNNASNACLSQGYCVAKAQVFNSAFDLAIASEALKN